MLDVIAWLARFVLILLALYGVYWWRERAGLRPLDESERFLGAMLWFGVWLAVWHLVLGV